MNNVPLSCESSVIVYDTALVIHSIDVCSPNFTNCKFIVFRTISNSSTPRNCCELNRRWFWVACEVELRPGTRGRVHHISK